MDDSDWSSSDDGQEQEIETSVLLGVPDGFVDSPSDLADAAVSRIGGHPALLPSFEPSFESSHCRHCAKPMELLVQLWCPFEGSFYDRALYIWACARGGCQRKDGCVRAWRGLKYNAEYARKLQRISTSTASSKASSKTECASSAANPFVLNVPTNQQLRGLGSNVFQQSLKTPQDIEDDKADVHSISSTSSIVQALASTVISDSPWQAAPHYPPQYLSTVSEFIPSQPKKQAPPAEVPDNETDAWSSEKYENSMHIDRVFEAFAERVALESQQCVRYDLGGRPLPFATDTTFNELFTSDVGDPTLPAATRGGLDGPISHREYRSMSIPSCPSCGSKRTFECQLMPNLINILGKHEAAKQECTDLERRQQVKALVSGDDNSRGMQWGTIMVFSCEKDCCLGGSDQNYQDAWMEEIVMIQWDI